MRKRKFTEEVIAGIFEKVKTYIEKHHDTIESALDKLKVDRARFYKYLNEKQKKELLMIKIANRDLKHRAHWQKGANIYEPDFTDYL